VWIESSHDFDAIESRLERRADLLNSATDLLIAAARQGRAFTIREQDAWDWATSRAELLRAECDVIMASLRRRGYRFPRPVH
jgi:DNA-binding IclR family transcriptional regulator